jgi:subtilisin family serine protease
MAQSPNQISVTVVPGGAGTVRSATRSEPATYDPSRLIVRFRTGAPVDRLPGTAAARVLSADLNLQLLDVPPGLTVAEAASRYRANPNVLYAEPDYIVQIDTTPNDTRWADQWDMVKIAAPAAWNTQTDASDLVVAVVDTGVNFSHPDLAANIWSHPSDSTIHGYTCIGGVCNAGGNDDQGHGTHVAGTIGAVGNNNLGIAGINWNARIAAFKFLNSAGSGAISDAIVAFDKIRSLIQTNGVNFRVTNNSWGGGGFSQGLKDAMAAVEALGAVNVCAAGNSAVNVDVSPMWPGAYNNRGIISVIATDSNDNGASFTNYGLANSDIAAPGVGTLSTVPTGTCALCDASGYKLLSGTSMAAPHVAGVVAAMMHLNPLLTAEQARDVLLDPGSYDWMTNTRAQSTSSGGRLNFSKVISNPKLANPPALNNFPTITMADDVSASAGSPVTISASTSDPDGDTQRTSLGRMPSNAWLFGWMVDSLFPAITNNPSTFTAPSLARKGVAVYAGSVADNRGGGASATQVVTVSPLTNPGSPPTGNLSASSDSAPVGGSITFTYNVTDPDGSGFPAWDFWSAGKGGASGSCCYTGSAVTMQFNTAGVYRVSTQAVDRRLDLSARSTTVVRIGSPSSGEPPIASAVLDKLSGPAPLTVNINMGGSLDPDGVIAYYMYGCGGSFSPAVTTPQGSCTFTNPGTYWLLLQALDNSNQMDLVSAYVVVTPDDGSGGGGADTTPPTVAMTSPDDGATVSGTVTVSANANDASGITKVDFYSNGVKIGADTSAPYAIDWDTSTLTPGSYTLNAVATDGANNSATSDSRNVTVESPPPPPPPPPPPVGPTVSISYPADGSTVKRKTTVTITAAVTAGSNPVSRVDFFVNSVLTCSDNNSAGGYTCAWKVPAAPNKKYTITATAYDSAGLSATSPVVNVTAP